ncbi:hypothetical protein [Propionivibrio sp.]|uniref:hypothetical protein n=1 Tax=Propionivibrio sp. TaxID=2212460 RepID=UPI003BEF6B06
MTWFSLPITQADNKAAFYDSTSATRWLAGQPQANAPAMLAELVTQIQAFNGCGTSPRERFKTLEVLRKTLFAVSGECQRRYENKALPLLPAEQLALDMSRQLWRACRVAYLHCLRACLDGDPSIAEHSAKVAHRVLSCLRMEQMNCYLAGAELDADFWRNLHALLASAERLGVVREPVADRLLGETSESTVSGQYCMILLLHLACPFSLARAQFAATIRWFARWREQVAVLGEPDIGSKACCIALDLAQERPLHDNLRVAGVGRWLSIGGVLRKIRKRLELLVAGESPESLKLGSGLSSEAAVALLNELYDHLKCPRQSAPDDPVDVSQIAVAAGLESIYRLLGGKGLKDSFMPATSFDSQLNQQQIALFGHVVRETEPGVESNTETWRAAQQEAGKLRLIRPAGSGASRLVLKGLLAIQLPQHENYALATISSLYSRCDGSLNISASLLSGEPTPLLAEMREKPSGKISRHPAFLLPATEGGNPASVLLPVGVPARSLSIRFYEAQKHTLLALGLADCNERGGDNERWSVAAAVAVALVLE